MVEFSKEEVMMEFESWMVEAVIVKSLYRRVFMKAVARELW